MEEDKKLRFRILEEQYDIQADDIILARAMLEEFVQQRKLQDNIDVKITYSNLSEKINYHIRERQLGEHLEKISLICNELGLPFISGIVVSNEYGVPSSRIRKNGNRKRKSNTR